MLLALLFPFKTGSPGAYIQPKEPDHATRRRDRPDRPAEDQEAAVERKRLVFRRDTCCCYQSQSPDTDFCRVSVI